LEFLATLAVNQFLDDNIEVMEFLKIVLFTVLAAIGYGIVHDQVTAHLCVEYFTVAHPPVFRTQSPFWLAIGWGIIATWWVGLPLGIGIAAGARVGGLPKLSLAVIRPMIFRLLAVMAVCAAGAGLIGYFLVATGRARVPEGWGEDLPTEKWAAFSADAYAHVTSYLTGAIGGLILVFRVIWGRARQATL